MQAVKVILFIVLILAVLCCMLYLVSLKLKKDRLNRLKNTKMSPQRRIHELICVEIFNQNVMSGFHFPISFSRNGVALRYKKIDTVAITSGGVAVITTKEQSGKIDNTNDDIWVEKNEDSFSEFDNPLIESEKKRHIILNLLKRANLTNIPVYSIVVFTSSNVEFESQKDGLVHVSEFVEMLSQLKAQKALSLKEMFAVRKVLFEHKLTGKQVKEHMKKIYG